MVDLFYRHCQLFHSRLGKVSQQQADARAIMIGRAYRCPYQYSNGEIVCPMQAGESQ